MSQTTCFQVRIFMECASNRINVFASLKKILREKEVALPLFQSLRSSGPTGKAPD